MRTCSFKAALKEPGTACLMNVCWELFKFLNCCWLINEYKLSPKQVHLTPVWCVAFGLSESKYCDLFGKWSPLFIKIADLLCNEKGLDYCCFSRQGYKGQVIGVPQQQNRFDYLLQFHRCKLARFWGLAFCFPSCWPQGGSMQSKTGCNWVRRIWMEATMSVQIAGGSWEDKANVI